MDDKHYWYEWVDRGRSRVTDWRGLAIFGVLFFDLTLVPLAENNLRKDHFLLFVIALIPLALAAAAIAILIIVKTKPYERRGAMDVE